jgi:hypothetical protein
MAIVTRRYAFQGTSNFALTQYVDPSAGINRTVRTAIIDIDIDDAVDGIDIALDEYMASIGWVYNPAAGVVNIEDFPQGFIRRLRLQHESATEVEIGTGRCRSEDNSENIRVQSPILVDITASGVNGLDSGSEASDTWYFVYVIADSEGVLPVAGLLSLSSSTPTLPVGYDVYRRIGSVRNDGSGDLIDFAQSGRDGQRRYDYRTAESSRQVLTGGSATTPTNANASALVPSTTRIATFHVRTTGQATDVYPGAIGNPVRNVRADSEITDTFQTGPTQRIAYANAAGGGSTDIWVSGYIEEI